VQHHRWALQKQTDSNLRRSVFRLQQGSFDDALPLPVSIMFWLPLNPRAFRKQIDANAKQNIFCSQRKIRDAGQPERRGPAWLTDD
jgi:hypothetical protein